MKKELFVLLVPLFLGCSSVPEEFVMEFPNTRDWAEEGDNMATWMGDWWTWQEACFPWMQGQRVIAIAILCGNALQNPSHDYGSLVECAWG